MSIGLGGLRASTRLATLAVRTLTHLGRLPEGDARAALECGCEWAGQVLDAVGVRVSCSGAIPSGPVLIVANHRSYIDIPVVLAQIPCAFLAKQEIASWPLFGRAAAGIHSVFVDRACPQSRASARRQVVERLQRGLSVAAFPEGTTSREPGLRPFHPGLFEEARRHGFPVCPVAIAYADPDDAWVDDAPFLPHFMARFRRPSIEVRIAFGRCAHAGEVADLREYARDWIEAELGPSSSGVPGLAERAQIADQADARIESRGDAPQPAHALLDPLRTAVAPVELVEPRGDLRALRHQGLLREP